MNKLEFRDFRVFPRSIFTLGIETNKNQRKLETWTNTHDHFVANYS